MQKSLHILLHMHTSPQLKKALKVKCNLFTKEIQPRNKVDYEYSILNISSALFMRHTDDRHENEIKAMNMH